MKLQLAVKVALVAITCCVTVKSSPLLPGWKDSYSAVRQKYVEADWRMRIGGDLILTGDEQIVDRYLLQEKAKLIDNSRLHSNVYLSATSFFQSKQWMENTSIFKVIKKMPKGAALHNHDLAIGSLEWVVKNATYRDNVYMCIDKDNFIQLSVFKTPPSNPGCPWKLLKTEREASASPAIFDAMLIRNISLLSSDPQQYKTSNAVWQRFNKYFAQVTGLLFNAPIMKDYFRQALTEFQADNVQYLELRALLEGWTTLDGAVHDAEFAADIYKEVAEEFVRENPDFSGAKIIMTGLRMKPNADIQKSIQTAMKLYKKYPDFFKGYDLVGQEDPNFSLLHYIDQLLYPKRQNPPVDLPFFFHAGETKWQETEVDYNLLDALLLNTTRIGHGYALSKHPFFMELVKEGNVGVEICPISNQILGFVSDLRNHAMAPLMANDFPLVISSDDPGAWEAAPLSHDMFVAFMDLAGQSTGLSFLKQLAMNSIKYSAMSATEKFTAMALWQTKWDTFIQETIERMVMADIDYVNRHGSHA